MISEELLHFIWQFRFFDQLELQSQEGERITVVDVGRHNSDAGPDFLFARVRIDDKEWYGHVELHIDAADWRKHRHQSDPAYNNVVLHVVWEGDTFALRADGSRIPTLQLVERVDKSLLSKYSLIKDNQLWIPCEKQLAGVNDMIKTQLLQRQAAERLGYKYNLVYALIEETNRDWDKVLFILLCRSFGMKVNAEAFMSLGNMLDVRFFQKYQDDLTKLEALVFGQAGWLDTNAEDDYHGQLKEEYAYLKKLHQLTQMDSSNWKFMRMRPYNFPTFRAAQLIGLYTWTSTLFADILFAENIQAVQTMFENVVASSYWGTHFSFGKPSSAHSRRISPVFVEHLLINAFIPTMFAYGKSVDDINFQYKAIEWLESIKPEKNNITSKFSALSMPIRSAADSQAVLHLKEHACDKKQCLKCAVGLSVLRG